MKIKGGITVSVIIPFVDNHKDVMQIKSKLDQQTYPAEFTEIIFVDNGSKNNVTFPESFLKNVTLLREYEKLNSPYSARNRGIEVAKGNVIVFIDANSHPLKNWLECGINCLEQTNNGIAAGDVQFDIEATPAAAHIVDALTSINMRNAVQERGVAYTANLFIRKEILEDVGLFEEGARSGGDVRWSMRAGKKGYRVTFCDEAVVLKFPRSLDALIKKKIRTGKGYFYTWKEESEKPIWFYNLLRSLKPPKFSRWKNDPYRVKLLDQGSRTAVWILLYLTGIVEQLAFSVEYFRYNLGKQRDIDRREELDRKNIQNGE
jgi:glycosyltransferase AglE